MIFLKKINREADKVAGNVLKEAFSEGLNREFSYADMAILGILENIINQVKSLEILHEQNHNTSADIIIRAIFENYVYLKFLLKDNTELKGKSYQYSVRLSEFSLVDKLKDQSLDGKRLRDFIGVKLVDIENMYDTKTDPGQRVRIEKEYLEVIGMKRLEQKWYNLDGKTKNFKDLCNHLQMNTEYEFIYSLMSKEAHGKDANEWFELKEYLVMMKQSSNYKENYLHIQLASMYLMESVKEVYNYYGMKSRKRHFEAMLGVHKRLS